jgi:hypothetical protein
MTDAGLKTPRVVLLGAKAGIDALLKRRGIPYTTDIAAGGIAADVVVIDDESRIDAAGREAMSQPLRQFAESGGRLVLLGAYPWNGIEFTSFPDNDSCSRAFICPGANHPFLANLEPRFLWRFNGLPGLIVDKRFKTPLPQGSTALMWADMPESLVVANIKTGKGEVVICPLVFRDRLNPADKTYDPVAERMMLNLLLR